MLTREELARLVIKTLDQQQRYFKSGKSTTELRVSQELERRLRREAQDIIDGGGLPFGDESEDQITPQRSW